MIVTGVNIPKPTYAGGVLFMLDIN